MKKSFYLLIVTGLIISTLSCGKYDDGPFFSLRTKKGRLDNHWTISVVYNNYQDVTNFYPEDYGYIFDKNGIFKKISNALEDRGTWEFNSDKTEILLSYDDSAKSDAYEILRLTNKHLWWKRVIVSGGQVDIYEEHFEVKKK